MLSFARHVPPLTGFSHASAAARWDARLVEVLDPLDYTALNYAVTKRVLVTRCARHARSRARRL